MQDASLSITPPPPGRFFFPLAGAGFTEMLQHVKETDFPSPPALEGLETSRLVFRRLTAAHVGELHAMDNDPRVMRFINGGKPSPWERFQEKALAWVDGLYTASVNFTFWAAHEKDGGKFIGWFHLRPQPRHDNRMELGYRLRHEAWGRGFATEGSRALITCGFELGLKDIMATTLERNLPSRHVLEKSGMRLEESFIYPEKILPFWSEVDRAAVLYSIKAEDRPLQ